MIVMKTFIFPHNQLTTGTHRMSKCAGFKIIAILSNSDMKHTTDADRNRRKTNNSFCTRK